MMDNKRLKEARKAVFCLIWSFPLFCIWFIAIICTLLIPWLVVVSLLAVPSPKEWMEIAVVIMVWFVSFGISCLGYVKIEERK